MDGGDFIRRLKEMEERIAKLERKVEQVEAELKKRKEATLRKWRRESDRFGFILASYRKKLATRSER